ncbi:polysaccharide deacetylase family protein [Sphingomonas sp. RP10(2022)]|uniref:Polysaccharide deacetylase family protein n=1 Tax=Sphingomonas liriopis TaxID=2949094 RepID=A0A9X2HSF1_9SPHN|nr:polysaccharide deacetylase family protein [Sphingomonas liriopis]MCP3736328.1 polysaccharide deacetylase family protein [Sphingomonas liriopis]
MPYRVPAPARDALIRWPAAFGTRFLVFVDVEEEFDWSAPLDPRNRSVTAMRALPAAHARFADHGVSPAYMVDHPVASDPAAVDILRGAIADGRSAIGAQLHSWVTPPYAPPAPGDSYAGNLPPELEVAKLDALTTLLTDAFGRPPLAYRAGRYGIGPATTALLASRGYRIETSVRARYDYRHDGGPDFTGIGNAAYRWGPLLELPLTSVFTGALRRSGSLFYPALGRIPHARGAFARAGLLQRIALTPEDMPIDDAIAAVRIAVREQGQRLLSFSFHSPSLEPGHTPYVRDAADLRHFWNWWSRMFATLVQLGVTPVTLDEVLAVADRRV